MDINIIMVQFVCSWVAFTLPSLPTSSQLLRNVVEHGRSLSSQLQADAVACRSAKTVEWARSQRTGGLDYFPPNSLDRHLQLEFHKWHLHEYPLQQDRAGLVEPCWHQSSHRPHRFNCGWCCLKNNITHIYNGRNLFMQASRNLADLQKKNFQTWQNCKACCK